MSGEQDIDRLAGVDRESGRIDDERMAENQARVEHGFWAKLASTLGRIPFAEEAIAAYYCARDPATPTRVRAILLGALAYFVLPTDALPDFIALMGFTDDAAVLFAAIRTVSENVTEAHRERARAMLARLKRGEVPPDGETA